MMSEARLASLEANYSGLRAEVDAIKQRENDFYDRVFVKHREDQVEHRKAQQRDYLKLEKVLTGAVTTMGKQIKALEESVAGNKFRLALIASAIAAGGGGVAVAVGKLVGL